MIMTAVTKSGQSMLLKKRPSTIHCHLRTANVLLSTQRCYSSPSSSASADINNDLFANDNAFPRPNDEMLYRHGMPLLARAAYHARMGRTIAYDLFSSQNTSQHGVKKIEYSYHEILSMSTHIHNFFIEQKKKLIEQKNSHENSKQNQFQSSTNLHTPPPRIAFLCNPGPLYIATQFAAWSSGSIAVPMCTSHRSNELAYVLQDCNPAYVIDGMNTLSEGRELRMAAREASVMDRYWCLDDIMGDYHQNQHQPLEGDKAGGTTNGIQNNATYALGSDGDIVSIDSPAMIIYTSGTTGNPKGVVHTHRNIYHQITDLVSSWGWSHNDAILHFLPLHHVHGVINKLGCAIWAGGSVEFMRFHPVRIWERLAEASKRWKGDCTQHNDVESNTISTGVLTNVKDENENRREPTIFMAVPTIYAKMLEVIPQLPPNLEPSEIMHQSSIRLMVSGSAALPNGIFNRWKAITGHTILERYGMSEFAMCLSNPLSPIESRLPGYVGMPLPSVEVKIIDEDTGEVIPPTETATPVRSGELCVRGPTVFLEYWQQPHATAEAFDFCGYFKTGDVAEFDPINKSYFLLGRVSADIIKCGGHKLSSIQIERVLLEHPALEEVVVLGVPDETYGERVGLICRLKDMDVEEGSILDLKTLQMWCKDHMASYKIPSKMIVMEEDIPKNAMGKVSKKQLVHLFDGE